MNPASSAPQGPNGGSSSRGYPTNHMNALSPLPNYIEVGPRTPGSLHAVNPNREAAYFGPQSQSSVPISGVTWEMQPPAGEVQSPSRDSDAMLWIHDQMHSLSNVNTTALFTNANSNALQSPDLCANFDIRYSSGGGGIPTVPPPSSSSGQPWGEPALCSSRHAPVSPHSDINSDVHMLSPVDITMVTYPPAGDRNAWPPTDKDMSIGRQLDADVRNVSLRSPSGDRGLGEHSRDSDKYITDDLPTADKSIQMHSPGGDMSDVDICGHSPESDKHIAMYSPSADKPRHCAPPDSDGRHYEDSPPSRDSKWGTQYPDSGAHGVTLPPLHPVHGEERVAVVQPCSAPNFPLPGSSASLWSTRQPKNNHSMSQPPTGAVAARHVQPPAHVADEQTPGPLPLPSLSTFDLAPKKPTQRVSPSQRTEVNILNDETEREVSSSRSPDLLPSQMTSGMCKGLTPEEKKENRCAICFRFFADKKELQHHLKAHAGDIKPFECGVCGKTFQYDSLLQTHLRIHTGETPFKCTLCDKAFKQKGTLMSHMGVHNSGKKPFQCSICEKRFTLKGSLKTHKDVIHGPRNQVFECHLCDKKFILKGSLKSHMAIHDHNKIQFPCTICGKKFSTKGNLKSHVNRHSGVKPYLCTVCGKSSTQLCSHMKAHDAESQSHSILKSL